MTDQKSGPATISAAQFARLLEITPRWVQKLASDGVIPKAGRDRYPMVAAIQAYLRWLHDENRRAAQAAAATKLAAARTEAIEMGITAKLATLIPIEDHRVVLAEVVRVVRREVEKIPDALPSYVRERARVEISRSMAVISKTAADAAKKAALGEDVY